MAHFNFEKNLRHQSEAVKACVSVFDRVDLKDPSGIGKSYCNPIFDWQASSHYGLNIRRIQKENNIEENVTERSNIIDIMMETGTGKTYTYTKTIFELNKRFMLFKFIVVVPTLPIKAGTIDFLKSAGAREHFKQQYNKTIKLHIVESQKSKKRFLPSAISSFVNAGRYEKSSIQVLVINAGMINSKTLQERFDKTLLDKFSLPFEAIAATNALMIIDEPHKFDKGNKTWNNIRKMKPQLIFRYGATFPEKEVKEKISGKINKIKIKDYHNLVYQLTAVDSFNRNLVKGVIGHIVEFKEGQNIFARLISSNGMEASFELVGSGQRKLFNIAKGESLEKIHSAMIGLQIENLNKYTVILSNCLELKIGDKINPYSYHETLQEIMIKKAIKHHFQEERKYLTREVKIKPLTLFFIDNIDQYRNQEGVLRKIVEQTIQNQAQELLKIENDQFYKSYLEKTLANLSQTHGGYFSKDNLSKNEIIEREINEILHDKQIMLALDNPRRFIFSKWTLREGWDNPNIFQICKLRSSGSEISKLQEVGRGLRLPVNQYGHRVKEEAFFLHYFVDFSEVNFVEKLVNEINEKSGAISREKIYTSLNDEMIKQINEKYGIEKLKLLIQLDKANVIRRDNVFKENGFDYIKYHYPLIFEGVDSNKIRKSSDTKKKVNIRTEKYSQLKELWEKLNEKVILEYKINTEDMFKDLFVKFLKEESINFSVQSTQERIEEVIINKDQATIDEKSIIASKEVIPFSTISYREFLKQLAQELHINLKTLWLSFIESRISINNYRNQTTVRYIKQKFDNYLMSCAISQFGIEYQKVSSTIHPTKITKADGRVKQAISSSDIGILYSNEQVAEKYLFEELFYDSELEKNNIKTSIEEVIVFMKIPKNSIKIPVAGGRSYSPDFAYVVNFNNNEKKLYFVIETKNADEKDLREEERRKIEHAKQFFKCKSKNLKIEFKTQFFNKQIQELIQEIYRGEV